MKVQAVRKSDPGGQEEAVGGHMHVCMVVAECSNRNSYLVNYYHAYSNSRDGRDDTRSHVTRLRKLNVIF